MAREMLIFALAASAICCVALILLMKPLLVRYALARPNARSVTRCRLRKAAGSLCLAATILVAGIAIRWLDLSGFHLLLVAAVSVAFGIAGTMDDIKPMPALPRLAFQFVLLLVVFSKPEMRLFPDVPIIVEWTFTMLAGLWFVNLVNFMDGLDWITVATMVPITAFIAALGCVRIFRRRRSLVVRRRSAARSSALRLSTSPWQGFFSATSAPCPSAFWSDGSSRSSPARARSRPRSCCRSIHLADATITLLRRLARREKVWEAHRSHFYQQATDQRLFGDRGERHVFVLNLALAALAA